MKDKLIMMAVTFFLERLDSEDVKKWIDFGLDLIEDKVKASPNKLDDSLVLPIVRVIRDAVSIPDND